MAEPVDPWTLRCFFRVGRYIARYKADEFRVEADIGNPVTSVSRFPPGTRNVMYGAYDKTTDDQVFLAHLPIDSSGAPLWGRKLDPKLLMYQGVLYAKDEYWVDPAKDRRIFGWFYAKWRKLRCFLRGR